MVEQLTAPPLIRNQWLPMTYEEWVEWVPEGNLGEWVDGEGIIFLSASEEHQWTVALLYNLIARFAGMFDLGQTMLAPFDMRLWEGGPVREPDVLFVRNDHLDRWTRTGIHGAVDLAVEVISDDSVVRDREDKLRQYAKAGIPDYLMVDPRPRHFWFGLYRLGGDGQYIPVEPDSDGRYFIQCLPGLWLKAEWFRKQPLPDVDTLLFRIAPAAYQAWLESRRRAAELDAR